jgi:hypothetical protein
MTDVRLRAADADRERVAERLRTAAGEGRLSADELEERLETAFSARTEAELAALVADLPSAPASARERPARRALRERRELRPFLATSVLLVAIWALGGAGYFWPVWPILGWGLFVVGPGCRAPLRGTLRACRRTASSKLSTTR